MKKILFILAIIFATNATTSAQTLVNTTFWADSLGNDEIYGTYLVKPNTDSTAYTIKTSIQITSSPRTYVAADKNANNGLAHTKLTEALFKIPGVQKVELGTFAIKIYLNKDFVWDDVDNDVIRSMRGYAYWGIKKRLDDGSANH